jgi:lantibiotic modifying enzyme
MAMLAIPEHPAAAQLATRYADELLLAVDAGVRRGRLEPEGGFARGYKGIAWALAQYGVPGTKYRNAAGVAVDLDRQGGPANAGWCSGDAGTALARLAAAAPADLETYLKVANERPVLADMSLCHGELGAVEPLLWLAERDDPAIEAVRRRRAGLVLAAVQQYGPQCGTPRGVTSPGLLTGLAGIGYGLLRLGFGRRVPSVLLLEPDTGTSAHHSAGTGRTSSTGENHDHPEAS